MPDVWAKAFAPTIALLGCTTMPVILLTNRLVFEISSVRIFRVGLIEIFPSPKPADEFLPVPCSLPAHQSR